MKCLEYACCCCVSLHVGSYIAGGIAFLAGLIKIGLGASLVRWSYGSYCYWDAYGVRHCYDRNIGLLIFGILCILIGILLLIGAIVLLIGTSKKKSNLIKVYIVIDFIEILFSLGALIYMIIAFGVDQYVFYLLYLPLDVYLLIVVISYYQELGGDMGPLE